jgi:hypothetical protein
MSDNKGTSNSLSFIDRIMNDHKLSSEQGLYLVNRRKFLTASILGTAGLTLTPVQKAIAFSPYDFLWMQEGEVYKPQKKGFWATFLSILDWGASLFGFGGLIPTVTQIVRQIISNRREIAGEIITGAVNAGLGSIASRFPLNILNPPERAWGAVGFIPVNRQNSSDQRYITQALSNDRLNGASVHFNFNDAPRGHGGTQRTYRETGVISAPTTHAIIGSRSVFEQFGYRGQDFTNSILMSHKQTDSQRALGTYGADYSNDGYETADKVTFNVDYSNASDNSNGGGGEGEIEFHGLADKSASNKRMGLRRIRFSLDYPPSAAPKDGTTGYRLIYVKGYKQSRL